MSNIPEFAKAFNCQVGTKVRDHSANKRIETHKALAESASGEAMQTLGMNVNGSHLILLKSIFKHTARNVRQDPQL